MSEFWFIWIIMGIIFIVIEIFTPGFFMALVGLSAILTGVISIFIGNPIFLLLEFGFITAALLIFLRPILYKYFLDKGENKPSNVDGMIGKTVKVIEDIDNSKGPGYIKYYSDQLPAIADDDKVYKKDETVKIVRTEGIKVWVVAPDDEVDSE